MRPINTLRPGSLAHRAFRLVEMRGATPSAAVAAALGVDEEELSSLLAGVVKVGLLRFREDGTWCLGDGRPLSAADAPAPPAAPPRSTTGLPDMIVATGGGVGLTLRDAPPPAEVPRLAAEPSGAPPAPVAAGPRLTAPARAAAQATPEQRLSSMPKAVGRRVRVPPLPQVDPLQTLPAALRPAAPAPSEDVQPAAPAPAPAPGIDIDAVHHVRSAAAEPGPIEALPPGEIVELAPAAPAADLPMVAAWCSDGTYVIEARGARIDLTAAEALELWEHLTACRVPLGSAAA